MGEINWGRVLFLSILGFMLVMLFVIGVGTSHAGAWDPRDPDVVRVQGTVEGVNVYTVGWMRSFLTKAETLYSKESSKAVAFILRDFKKKFAELESYAQKLKSDPAVGTTMKPGDPKLTRLDELIAAANEPMFELITLDAGVAPPRPRPAPR